MTSAARGEAPAGQDLNTSMVGAPLAGRCLGGEGGQFDSRHREGRYNPIRTRPPIPRFGNDNPRWWKAVCEKYVGLYDVDHATWASFATMHFIEHAALWLQTYEAEHDVDSWEELCVAVHSEFREIDIIAT